MGYTGEPRSVYDLFHTWVKRSPDSTAITCEGERSISYQELHNTVNRIAKDLQQHGVQPGDMVPVLATRSPEMIATFFAILKKGACYIPIDIEAWSEDRIQSTIARISPKLVVNLGARRSLPCPELLVQEVVLGTSNEVMQDIGHHIKPEDLAYIIFTSGTTSTPKGVMIPHRALLNYVQQGTEKAPFNANATPGDVTLLIFSPGFDACTGLIFSALCNGAQILIPNSPNFLTCISQCTILTGTPSVLAAVQDPEACPKLRTIVLGGEAPPPWLVKKWWAPGRNIYNAYGPTETTICSLIGRIYPEQPITLGLAMPNSQVELYEGDSVRDQGEICISGPGLALGYFQDPERTAKAFRSRNGVRMYLTGDFARRTVHGLEYGGRADSLVKNRGFLINLESEVIPMLLKAGALTATAFMHQHRLLGFVTPASIDSKTLRSKLAANYEPYLVPDSVYVLEALPLTPNGKADNRELLRLLNDGKLGRQNEDAVDPGVSDDRRLKLLKSSISEAVSQDVQDILEDLSFWELGGNSLAALRVLSSLHKHGYKLSLNSLFKLPNLRAICDALEPTSASDGLAKATGSGSEHAETTQLWTAQMTSLQVKMIQASLKTPGANYMLMRIHVPHGGKSFDKAAFKAAWQQVLQRHCIFRTTFMLAEETQKIEPLLDLDWDEVVTTEARLDETVLHRSSVLRQKILAGHEDDGRFIPVHAYNLVTVPNKRSELLVAAHHAQADGWSFAIVLEEVQALLSGRVIPQDVPQFTHAAIAQRKKQVDAEGVSFWTEKLKHFPVPPKLSILAPSGSTTSSDWNDSLEVKLDCSTAQLQEAARRFRVLPSTLIYAAWALVLSSNSSTDHVSFGAVFSGRNLPGVDGVERMVGPLLNTVPFPITFKDIEYATVGHIVSKIDDQLTKMLEHQWAAPEVMATMRSEDITGLLQSIVVTEYDLPPLPGSWSADRQDLMEFGLSLLIESYDDDREALRGRMLFDRATYATTAIKQLLAQFQNCLREMMRPENTSTKEVCSKLLDAESLELLVGPPATSINTTRASSRTYNTVKEAFEAAAKKWPDFCAVECSRVGSQTYQQLNQSSDAIAQWLRSSIPTGVTAQDTVVAVLTDGTLGWIIAVLAAFKAGCICCAIDVNLPTKRMEAIAAQSGVTFFLAASRTCSEAFGRTKNRTNILIVDEYLAAEPEREVAPLATTASDKDIAYLVFTSGSTGTPKGVPLHNTSILSVIRNPFVRLYAAPGRRNAQMFGFGFDVVLVEIFGTLCYGGTLVLKDASDPFSHLSRVHATMATPSLLSACLPEDFPNLDTIALAGEPVPQSLVAAWADKVHLMNLYGPSECGPISTGTTLSRGSPVTIGRPLSGLAVYVLDHRRNPVAPGVVGEIYISGEQMIRGYWNRDAASSNGASFLPNPFCTRPEQNYMYSTGDLGYWTDNMLLCYMGRVDNQVKIRGHRIELEEVERALCAVRTANVESAAAITVSGPNGEACLIAFVTPGTISITDIRAGLVSLLPSYSRPSRIIALDKLPRSANLKLDRKALAALASHASVKSIDESKAEGFPDTFTHTEQMIAQIWRNLIGLDGVDAIHRDDDFLALGGNSLLAIRAARQITSSIGQSIPVAMLIRQTVLQNLATAIDQYVAENSKTTPAIETFQSYWDSSEPRAHQPSTARGSTLSPLESEMYDHIQKSATKQAFNTVVEVVIQGQVDIGILIEAITSIIRRNPILRSRYTMSEDGLSRIISDDILKPSYLEGRLNVDQVQALCTTPFDLAHDQLIRVAIFGPDSTNKEPATEVVIVTHHLITDKASLSILLRLFSNEYRRLTILERAADGELVGRTSSTELSLTPTEPVYPDWAQWCNLSQDMRAQETAHLDFWEKRLTNSKRMAWLPASGNLLGRAKPARISFVIPSSGSDVHGQRDLQFSQRVSVAATALALRALYETSDVVLGLPYMNRDDPYTADMLGLFVDRLPVRLVLDETMLASASSFLGGVAEEVNKAVESYLPYQQIKAVAAPRDDDELISIMLIYNWQTDALEKSMDLGPGLKTVAKKDGHRPEGLIFPMLIDISELEDGSLYVELEHSTELFSAELVARFVELFSSNMERLAQGLLPIT